MQGNLLSGFPAGIPEFPDSRESIPTAAKEDIRAIFGNYCIISHGSLKCTDLLEVAKASISYSELELIGLEIESALCLWSGERQDIVMQGKNSQCTNGLGCLVDMETLLSSNKIFLEYGKRSCLGCPRHGACIDRC